MSPDNRYVESIAESIVREYLSRKGMKSTLQVMDQECPRRPGSVSNRQILMKVLHLEKLMKENKEQESPLRAMLELMTKFFMAKESLELLNESQSQNSVEFGLELSVGSQNAVKMNQPTSHGNRYLTALTRPSTAVLASRKGKSNQDIVIEDELESETHLGEGKLGVLSMETTEEEFSRTKISHLVSSRSKPGAVISTVNDSADRRRHVKSKTTAVSSKLQKNYYTSQETDFVVDCHNNKNSLMMSSGTSNSWGEMGFPQSDLPSSKLAENRVDSAVGVKTSSFQELLSAGEEKANRLSRQLSEKSELSTDKNHSLLKSGIVQEKTSRSAFSHTGLAVKGNKMKMGDLEFGDVEDIEDDLNDIQLQPNSKGTKKKQAKQLDSKSIDSHTAIALKTLIFGSAMQCYSDEWRLQSFAFCDLPDLQFGIIQKKGGPCGVLASIQAVVLQEMLFGENRLPAGSGLKPSRNERTQYLGLALARIFWRAGEQQRAVVVLPSNQSYVMGSPKFRPDDVTETLVLYTFTSFPDLSDFIKHSIKQFEMDGNPGVVLCICGAVLSRGIDRVKKDMDEVCGKLMGAHGYCTQELVNLLLTGEAVSNVFNDIMELDSGTGNSMILKGISARSSTGFLSLFEHYKSCQVGTFLKTPKYPIWVVCSESHFSVLFSTRLELVSDWKAERRFDLFYYDGLARQQEQIKLTVCTTNKSYHPPSDEDLVPPLEHCIRTKWPGAEIDWNGYEPIL